MPVDATISITFPELVSVNRVQSAISTASSPPITCMGQLILLPQSMVNCRSQQPLQANTVYTIDVKATDVPPFMLSFTTGGPLDPTPIRIVATLPPNADIGRPRQTAITVQFSEPMDRASVEAAFSANVYQGGPIAFRPAVWDVASTTVTFQPVNILDYGALVQWVVANTARDQTGFTLRYGYPAQFRVVRFATAAIPAMPGASGYIFYSAGTLTSAELYTAHRTETAVRVGDRDNFGTDTDFSNGFFSFDLSLLPENLTALRSATLSLFQSAVAGNPYDEYHCSAGLPDRTDAGLGPLWITTASYGPTLDAGPGSNPGDMFSERVPPLRVQLPPLASAGPNAANVLALVGADWQDRVARERRSQFKLAFQAGGCTTIGNNGDGGDDYVDFASGNNPNTATHPQLLVAYEYP